MARRSEAVCSVPSAPSVQAINKVPAVTVGFWVIKIMSTTVGETGADYLAVNAGLGALATGAMMAAALVVAALLQVRVQRFVPALYWFTVVLVSIVGTQLTDALTDGFGVSLYASSAGFGLALAFVFLAWYRSERSLSIRTINTRRRELFYWAAILCTFALGTATGDLATEAWGLGFRLGVLVFGAMIGGTLIAWRCGLNAILAFWIAYILTRPLGASLGDLLTQSPGYGGLGLGAKLTSAVFLAIIVALVALAHGSGVSAVSPPSTKE